MSDFKPPMVNPFVIQLGNHVLLRLAFWWGYYDGVDIDDDCLQKISALQGKRVILCPNHSHPHDPIILWYLSKKLGEPFRFVAAREIFDSWHGLQGWLLQRLGVHSVDRQVIDRRSIATTFDIIKQGKQKLVIFPEGEISSRNDRLLSLQEGLVSLFLKAAAMMENEGAVYVLPLALRYRYCHDIAPSINNALLRIEQVLQLPNAGDLIERFQRVREKILQRICPELPVDPEGLSQYVSKGSRLARIMALLTFREMDEISPENLAAGIDLIERELFSRVTQKGRRRVRIEAGDPLNVSALLADYRVNKRKTVGRLASEIHEQLLELLEIAPGEAYPQAA